MAGHDLANIQSADSHSNCIGAIALHSQIDMLLGGADSRFRLERYVDLALLCCPENKTDLFHSRTSILSASLYSLLCLCVRTEKDVGCHFFALQKIHFSLHMGITLSLLTPDP
jgi:hypothetical protein